MCYIVSLYHTILVSEPYWLHDPLWAKTWQRWGEKTPFKQEEITSIPRLRQRQPSVVTGWSLKDYEQHPSQNPNYESRNKRCTQKVLGKCMGWDKEGIEKKCQGLHGKTCSQSTYLIMDVTVLTTGTQTQNRSWFNRRRAWKLKAPSPIVLIETRTICMENDFQLNSGFDREPLRSS